MKGILKRLLLIYLSALLVLLCSVTISMVLQHRAGAQLEEDARTINISGRQRMLSQRIIYLAQDLADNPNGATRADLLAAVEEFEGAISLFENSHMILSGADDLSPGLSDLYFGPDQAGSLDAQIRAYVQAARNVAADPGDQGSLATLRRIENAGLLASLNAVVGQYERESIALVRQLQRWEWIALAVAMGIVLVEITFVFLPGHRFVNKAVADLEGKTADLEAARGQLLERQRDLQASLAESERLRREQAEFTYAVSHDLKSPANSMQLFLSEIALENRDRMDEDGQYMLDMCQQTAVRMAEQVEDVLAYSGATDVRTNPETLSLTDTLNAVRQNLEAVIRSSGATIQAADLPDFTGHKTQIRILLQNLIENAIKYRHPDRPPVINLSAAGLKGKDGIALTVRDNGLGIDPKHHDKIFGLFQRLHLRDDIAGSGLGLCTCLRIAQNHGGAITVTSQPGEGSAFTVELTNLPSSGHHIREAA